MRLLADLHISPQTVAFLKSLGHDVVRVNDILPVNAADELIIVRRRQHHGMTWGNALRSGSSLPVPGVLLA